MRAEPQKTFYLETFGCQMNVHDSEKVIGTLISQGYRQVSTVEDAGLILYNTCSIRDKAEQKVFHRLADYKKLQAQGKKFGVLGCVAQQEGEKIFERAPYVSNSTIARPTSVSRLNSPPAPIRIAVTLRSSKAATNSAPTASFPLPAAKSAAAAQTPSSPRPARWPISAIAKSSSWVRM